MVELVRVKEKFQVTIPVQVRAIVAIRTGDYLEVTAVPEGILLRPQHMVTRAQSVRTILDFISESHGAGRDKAQIDADLNAQRDDW